MCDGTAMGVVRVDRQCNNNLVVFRLGGGEIGDGSSMGVSPVVGRVLGGPDDA